MCPRHLHKPTLHLISIPQHCTATISTRTHASTVQMLRRRTGNDLAIQETRSTMREPPGKIRHTSRPNVGSVCDRITSGIHSSILQPAMQSRNGKPNTPKSPARHIWQLRGADQEMVSRTRTPSRSDARLKSEHSLAPPSDDANDSSPPAAEVANAGTCPCDHALV